MAKATRNPNLPPRLRARRRGEVTYYFYDAGGKPRREIALGRNYLEAVRRWAELEKADTPAGAQVTFKEVADRYLREILPGKAPRTQKDNLAELEQLLRFFNDPPAPLDEIKPMHIRMYLDRRGKEAKVRANREKALFSHIFNKAREWGYTDRENPCRGVEGFAEAGRDHYVRDEVYQALWQAASEPVRDAMDLAYLTGQRPADVVKLQETDIRDGAIWIRQAKTRQKLRIEIIGQLAEVIDRIKARKAQHNVRSLALLVNETGQALTYSALDNRWEHVRQAAARAQPKLAPEITATQFRDLRAKAGTDKESANGMAAAKDQLGHSNESTTRRYVRHRMGKLVTPTR